MNKKDKRQGIYIQLTDGQAEDVSVAIDVAKKQGRETLTIHLHIDIDALTQCDYGIDMAEVGPATKIDKVV